MLNLPNTSSFCGVLLFPAPYLNAKLLDDIGLRRIDTPFHVIDGFIGARCARIRFLGRLSFLFLSQQLLEFVLDIAQVSLILEFRSPFLKLYEFFNNSNSCERFLISASLSYKKIDDMLRREVPLNSFRNLVELSQLVVPNLSPIIGIGLLAERKHAST